MWAWLFVSTTGMFPREWTGHMKLILRESLLRVILFKMYKTFELGFAALSIFFIGWALQRFISNPFLKIWSCKPNTMVYLFIVPRHINTATEERVKLYSHSQQGTSSYVSRLICLMLFLPTAVETQITMGRGIISVPWKELKEAKSSWYFLWKRG